MEAALASVLIWTQLQLESLASVLHKLHLKNHIYTLQILIQKTCCHHSFLKFNLFILIFIFILHGVVFHLSLLSLGSRMQQIPFEFVNGDFNSAEMWPLCNREQASSSPSWAPQSVQKRNILYIWAENSSDPPAYLAGSGLFRDAEECPLKS